VAQHFDQLNEVLEHHCLCAWRGARIEAREKVLAFPQQLDSLRRGCRPRGVAVRPQRLRGRARHARVYFTSGTQEGRPVDRV